MTPDHEAAKNMADAECRSPLFPGQASHNMAAAYLDLLAQRDEAEKMRDVAYGLLDVAVKERDEALALLEKAVHEIEESLGDSAGLESYRAFLAKHRKTGANDGK